MLMRLAQLLNSVNNLLVLLALHRNSDGHPAHDECGADMVVLCDRLQVRDLKPARWLLEHLRKVLGEEAVETLERAEAEHPVFGELCGGSGLAEVVCISGDGGVQPLRGLDVWRRTREREHQRVRLHR